jgi:osmotically-inducible protein OsmY
MKQSISILSLTALLSLTGALQGCLFAAGAAAGAVAIAVVYDHRTIEKTVEDNKIATKVSDKIKGVPALHDDSHINVNAFNGVVLLTGETPQTAWRQQAEDLARSVTGVTQVYNQISIEGPTSTFNRTGDTWITTKINSMMLAEKGLKSGSIKVITENGVVYLMGIVSHEQADLAVEIARQVSGVQKVVKVFQYNDKL